VATTNDLKNGLVLNLDGQLWTVTAFQHVKPGKGGAFVRTTLKNVMTGKVVDKTFNAGTKVETATVDRRDMTFLYRDGADFVFMDGDTFDQIPIPENTVGEAAGYLLENQVAMVMLHESVPLFIERTPIPACRATAPPAAPSPPRWRPARRSRCRCSSPPARRSRSTPATGVTSAAYPADVARPYEGPQAGARHPLRVRGAP
jgi:translation elongation factor P